MKRFIVFHGNTYYPVGGWEDFLASFDGLEEAKAFLAGKLHDESLEWGHVLDTETWTIVHKDTAQ